MKPELEKPESLEVEVLLPENSLYIAKYLHLETEREMFASFCIYRSLDANFESLRIIDKPRKTPLILGLSLGICQKSPVKFKLPSDFPDFDKDRIYFNFSPEEQKYFLIGYNSVSSLNF